MLAIVYNRDGSQDLVNVLTRESDGTRPPKRPLPIQSREYYPNDTLGGIFGKKGLLE